LINCPGANRVVNEYQPEVFPFTLELHLLGVPTRYRSDSAAVIRAVERALAGWCDLPAALVGPGPPVTVDILVREPVAAEELAPAADAFVVRAHGDTVLAARGDTLLAARVAQGSALAFVGPALLADEATLSERVIRFLGLLLASGRDRIPVRAVGVVRGGTALLLMGGHAADKAQLCAACLRSGFALLGDGLVYVSLDGGPQVWGAPGAGGLATHAERALVCEVERAVGQASRLEPLEREAAEALVADAVPTELEHVRMRSSQVARDLTAGVSRRLLLGSDPASAVALLSYLSEA
jgi:hypothetical protein